MLSADTVAARERGRVLLEQVWERSPHTRRATTLLRRVAREVLDLSLQARLERGQLAAHIPRDPVDDGRPSPPLSLQEIVSDRLGEKVSGKVCHKAMRLLERMHVLEIYFVHPSDELRRHTKAVLAFSKRRRNRKGGRGTFYHAPMHAEPRTPFLQAVRAPTALLRVEEVLPELAALARRPRGTVAPAGELLRRDIGTVDPEQFSRQAYKTGPEVLRGGAPPGSGPPPRARGRGIDDRTGADSEQESRGAASPRAVGDVGGPDAQAIAAALRAWRERQD